MFFSNFLSIFVFIDPFSPDKSFRRWASAVGFGGELRRWVSAVGFGVGHRWRLYDFDFDCLIFKHKAKGGLEII